MVTSAEPRKASTGASIGKDQMQGLWIVLTVLIHNSMQLPMYQTPVQAVVTCAMRGPCRPGKEVCLNEKDRDRHSTKA